MPQVQVNFDTVPDKDIPVRSGIYDFQILKAEVRENKNKDGLNLVIDAKITSDGQYKGRSRTMYLSTKMETQMKRLCLSAGVPVGATGFNTDDLVGKIFKAAVQSTTYKNDAGMQKEGWDISDYLIPGDEGFPKAA